MSYLFSFVSASVFPKIGVLRCDVMIILLPLIYVSIKRPYIKVYARNLVVLAC
jgi:hypothetical protein